MGADHCAWLADDGSVWTCGKNSCGQLGLGDQTDRERPSRVPNLPPISVVQSGGHSTLCLDTSSNVWSFGRNNYGQLGLGNTTDRSSPQMVPGLPPVLSFSSSGDHTIFLCKGSLWAFGHNEGGELGLGNTAHQSAPVQLPASCFANDVIFTSCGFSHSFFLTTEGQVFSCGYNSKGQLGLGDSTSRSTPSLIPNVHKYIKIACGGNMSCMVDTSHRLWVCGSHSGSQKTPLCFPSVGAIQKISIGYNHTLCINQKGELWGWGDPSNGELGNGSTQRCEDPILLQNNVQNVLCHYYNSFTRNASGEDFCSGKNTKGQLGLGNTANQLSFTPFNPKEFTMRFPEERARKQKTEEENSRLMAVLGAEGLESFLETENAANDQEAYVNGEEEGSKKIRAAGWKRKAEELEEHVQTILLATTDAKESFDEKRNRIKKIKENIELHKSALEGLEEELAEVQSQADQLASVLEYDITTRPQELMKILSTYTAEEGLLNEELTGLLESKSVPDLSSSELAILLWKMDLSHIHPIMEENEVNGELLCSLNWTEMAAMFQMSNQEAYTMQYYLELMKCPRYNINEIEETECPVCAHNTPQMTLALMAEHRIPIPPELIKEGRWTTPQIIYSAPGKDFQLPIADQISCAKSLSVLRRCHKEHLTSLSQ